MRFLAIDLLAYGHFEKRRLVFPADGPNLHILHGANEAGKSTTLRAITGFLYGIERTTNDAHRFGSELRIGARLQHSSQQERYLVRRKSTSGSLLDEAERPVDESQLSDWLSVRDRKQFEAMFGLSHEQLRKAGDALASSKNAAAEALFSAALEGASLRSTMLKLQDEAEAILTAAGQGGSLAKAMRRYRELRDAEKKAEKSSTKWRQIQEDLAAAVETVRRLDEEIRAVRGKMARLERIRKSLDPLRRHAVLGEERAALGPVRLLAADVGERRRRLVRDQDDADISMAELTVKIARAQRERDALVVPDALVAFAPRKREFNDKLGAHKKETLDRPRLVHEILPYRREAEELLRQLGRPDLLVGEAATIRMEPTEVERVRRLQNEHLTLQSEKGQLLAQLVEAEAEHARCASALAGAVPARDVAVLRTLWERSDAEHDLDRTLRTIENELDELSRRAAEFARGLGFGDGQIAELARRHVPSEQEIRAAEAEEQESRAERSLLEKQRQDAVHALEAAKRSLAAHEERPIPSPERLCEARAQRDQAWAAVRRAWAAGAPMGDPPQGGASEAPLAEALTLSMQQADAVADALWGESARVEQHAQLRRAVADHEAHVHALDLALLTVASRDAERVERWRTLWKEAAIEPSSPREMVAWYTRWEHFVAIVHRHELVTTKLRLQEDNAAALRRSLEAALAVCGLSCPPGLPWPALRVLVEQTLLHAQAVSQERSSRASEVDRLASTLAKLRGRLAQLEERLGSWQADWANATIKMCSGEPLEPGAAPLILDIHARLFEATGHRDRLEKRIRAIDKNIAAFELELGRITTSMGLDLDGSSTERAETLLDHVSCAERAQQRRSDLTAQIASLEAELDTARSRRERAVVGLARLFEETGTESVEALEIAEERSAAARALDERRAETEQHLRDLSEGWSLHDLEAAAAGMDGDQIRDELAVLEGGLQSREEARAAAHRTMGELRERETQYTASDNAAQQLEDAQAQAETVRSLAERFAHLRVASLVLQRAMARYQDESQTEILKRAEQLFTKLTRGRYTGLRVEYEGDGATLRCLRGNEAVQVKERVMSDGTLDQLYLALRLASIEQQLSFQEPMPLVLDDIFIHFDDDRAQAGIEVLAEFSKKTQVLLLTHHTRTLELALRALPPGIWNEIRLEPPHLPCSRGRPAGADRWGGPVVGLLCLAQAADGEQRRQRRLPRRGVRR